MIDLISLNFTVNDAIGKGRPRFFRGHAVTPKETRQFELEIAAEATKAKFNYGMQYGKPWDLNRKSYEIYIRAYFPIPKSWSKKKRAEAENGILKPQKPDIDNIAKAILDGLNGIAYIDDKSVFSIKACKYYKKDIEGRYCEVDVFGF